MQNILRKARLAIKSRYNYNRDLTQIQKKRLSVCKECPYNSDNKVTKTLKDRFLLVLNNILNFTFGINMDEDAICTECGCNLVHKSSQEDSQDWCNLGKWDNIK